MGRGPGTERPLEVQVTHGDGRLLVRLTGELDAAAASSLSARVRDAAGFGDDAEPRAGGDVELDLSGLVFLDVAGFRAIVTLRDLLAGAGRRLLVRGLDETRLPVTRVLGLDQYLRVSPTKPGDDA